MGTHYRGTEAERRALDAYIKLARCVDVLDGRLRRALRGAGLSLPQLGALEALYHLGPLSQTALGSRMLRTRGSVTSLLDHLGERGWIRRERLEDDRRVVLVHLTPTGRGTIEAVLPRHVERIERLMASLTEAEQEELARLCRKLGRSAAEALPPNNGLA